MYKDALALRCMRTGKSKRSITLMSRQLCRRLPHYLPCLVFCLAFILSESAFGELKITDPKTGKQYKSLNEAIETSLEPTSERFSNAVVLYVREDNSIFISEWEDLRQRNGTFDKQQRVPLAELKERLSKIAKIHSNRIKNVVLTADPNVSYKDLAKVVHAYEDAVSRVGPFDPGDIHYIFFDPYDNQAHSKDPKWQVN